MNKYQQAFYRITDWFHSYRDEKGVIVQEQHVTDYYNEQKEIIRELVERAEPKKPIYEADGYADGELVYDTWLCPNCGKDYEVDYDKYDYCPNCGQRLDWSDSDE